MAALMPIAVDLVSIFDDKIRTVEGILHGAIFAIIPENSDPETYGSLLIDVDEAALYVNEYLNITMPLDTLQKPLQRVMSLDGAVLVSGLSGGIIGVGVQLERSPLKRALIINNHGTKHNSALKMTEACESVVIVRSDNGNVTIFTRAMSLSKRCHRIDPVSNFRFIISFCFFSHASISML